VMWNQTQVKPIGRCKVVLFNPKNHKKHPVDFIVVKNNLMPVLGAKNSQLMELLTFHSENVKHVAAVNSRPTVDVIEQYKDVFVDELGVFPGPVHLEKDPSVSPHVAASRRIPVSIQGRVKAELDLLVKRGVLSPVDRPTDWVSNMVVAVKISGELRVCLDPKPLNVAMKREHVQLPILDDVLPELSKTKIFSSVDLRNGYHHVLLDDESSLLTTFATAYGWYRYLRLPFGPSVSSEIFQKKVLAAVGGLPGVLCIADDVILYGVGDTHVDSLKDHDQKLVKLFERCRQVDI